MVHGMAVRFLVGALVALSAGAISPTSVGATTFVEDPAISAPSNLCATSADGAVDLWWDASTDIAVTGYLVEHRDAPAAEWVPAELGNVLQHTLAVGGAIDVRVAGTTNDGRRSSWAGNCLLQWGGQLGGPIPEQAGRGTIDLLAGETIADVAMGGYFQCALTAQGSVACWGQNSDGQLGVAPGKSFLSEPTAYVGGALAGVEVTQVAAGGAFACALTVGGAVACWGRGGAGERGTGGQSSSHVPALVTGGAMAGKVAVAITAGGNHACALTSLSQVICWGYNSTGQLGDGTSTSRLLPVLAHPGSLLGAEIVSIDAGEQHTCALTSAGALSCWGSNEYGQVGDGASQNRLEPVAVSGGALGGMVIVDVEAASVHTCARTSDSLVACWGFNTYGYVGDGTTVMRRTPTAVLPGAFSGDSPLAVSATWYNSCALVDSGDVYCWGINNYAALGTYPGPWSHTPIQIAGGGMWGGGADKVFSGAVTTLVQWNGRIAPNEPPAPPTNVTRSAAGHTVTVGWTAPGWEGAALIEGYRVEFSNDGGRTWSTAANTPEGAVSAEITVPADGFWAFRVETLSAVGISVPSSPTPELLVNSTPRTVRTFVAARVVTSAGLPIVATSITWRTPDNALSSAQPALTGLDGSVVFPALATGPVIFEMSAGWPGNEPIEVQAALVTEFVGPSTSPVLVTLPDPPQRSERVVSVTMPDGNPVPGASIVVHGGLAQVRSSSAGDGARVIVASWRALDWTDSATTGGNGEVVLRGFLADSIGADAVITFSDGVLAQQAVGTLANGHLHVVLDQMPLVELTSAPAEPVSPGTPLSVEVTVTDGDGNPVSGSTLSLVSSDGEAAPVLAGASLQAACSPDLSDISDIAGHASFTLCPMGTSRWRVVGNDLVDSPTFDVEVEWGTFAPLVTPFRLVDTRPGYTGAIESELGSVGFDIGRAVIPNVPVRWEVTGRLGVPNGVGGLALNVTAVLPVGSGFLKVYPCGAVGDVPPATSSVNFRVGVNQANAAVVAVGAGGGVCVVSSQETHVVLDVSGYLAGAGFVALGVPARLVDTRGGQVGVIELPSGSVGSDVASALAPSVPVRFVVTGVAGVPVGPAGLALNVTAVLPVGSGFLKVYPCGAVGDVPPATSSVNFRVGVNQANAAVVAVGAGGGVCVVSSQETHVVLDVSGYFAAGAGFVALGVPARLVDTRGGQVGVIELPSGSVGSDVASALAPSVPVRFVVTGVAGVPVGPAGLALNVTAVLPVGSGFLKVYPCGAVGDVPPATSSVNFRVGVNQANAAVVAVGAGGGVCVVSSQETHVVLDVSGYFAAP